MLRIWFHVFPRVRRRTLDGGRGLKVLAHSEAFRLELPDGVFAPVTFAQIFGAVLLRGEGHFTV